MGAYMDVRSYVSIIEQAAKTTDERLLNLGVVTLSKSRSMLSMPKKSGPRLKNS